MSSNSENPAVNSPEKETSDVDETEPEPVYPEKLQQGRSNFMNLVEDELEEDKVKEEEVLELEDDDQNPEPPKNK